MADKATLRIAIDARGAHTGALGFGRATDMVEHSARRAIGVITALAGGAGILYLLNREKELIDTTAKLSDRLGMSTQSLIGLQHGAKLAGVEQGLLNQSLEMFTRNLGEMAMGGTSSKQSLDALGLSYKDLIDKSPDEAIGIVADQINKLSTQSEKAAAIQDLFGRGSTELLNLFAEGSKGIAAYRAETEKLGLSFDRIDAAKVEAANDALERLKSVFTGVFRQTVIELAPYIEAATGAFVDWATQGEGVGARITTVFETVTLSVVKTGEEVERLIVNFNRLTSPLDYARQVTEANLRAIERYRKESGDIGAFQYTQGWLRPPMQPTDLSLFERIQIEEKNKLGLGVMERESSIRAAFEKLRDKSERRYVNIEDIPWAGDQAATSKLTAEEMKNVVDRTRDAMESVRHQDYLTRMERIESLKIYRDENAATLAKVEEANRALDSEIRSLERSRLDAMRTYQMELREDFEDFSLYQSEKAAEVARSIEGSMSNAFHSMISEGASWRDAMSQFFIDVGNAFSRMAADMAARKIMDTIMGQTSSTPGGTGGNGSNGLLSILGAVVGGIFGGPAGAMAGSAIGSSIGGSSGGYASGTSATATPGAGRFALGGVFDRGRVLPFANGGIFPGPTYFPLAGGKIGLAGEAGPEAAVPLRRMPSGRLGVETSGPPTVTVQPRVIVRAIIVKNEREAALEAMRSDEGQAVVINALQEHGLL